MLRIITAVAAIALATPAVAAEFRPFDRAAFETALAAGGPIVVDVHATWCPVCASQAKTIAAITAAPEFARLTVFRLAYDGQKPEWQRFKVSKQGTLIAFTGGREIGRLNFVTDKPMIAALLASTVK